MKFFEQLERGTPVSLNCCDCAKPVATIALPDFAKGGRTVKILNAGLGTMLDADVDLAKLNPNIVSDSLKVRCASCTTIANG